MTSVCAVKRKKDSYNFVKIFLCLALFALALFFGEPVKNGVINGFKICFFNIIPTLFPFFILSDLWGALIYFHNDSVFSKSFEKIFGINGEGASAFLLGNICGFPLGVKCATQKYLDERIEKRELEALSVICNNPSAAFVISGVGLGLLGSIKIGLILYFSTLISAILIGIIFRIKPSKIQNSKNNERQKFDLIESIKAAGISSITVSSYIIFFSTIIGVASAVVNSPIALSIISVFLEVGSACSVIAGVHSVLGDFTLPLISFSLSFSGMSVFMQAFSILPSFVSKKGYLLKKLFQGILSAILTLILCTII